MFEEIASDAVKMLLILFWITATFIIIWGTLWIHAYKKSKAKE